MSFLFGGRPQLSSAEKIAAAETEIEMVSDMFNRLLHVLTLILSLWVTDFITVLLSHVRRNAFRPTTAKVILTKANPCALIGVSRNSSKST